MPPQVKRLIPLFAIFIGLFLLVRHFLVPDSFGQFGHYRGNSLEEIASGEIVYADREDCHACHSDILETVMSDAHAGLSCLTCHGPGLDHVNDPRADNIHKETGREFCGRCHDQNPARQADVIFQVDLETHNIEFENCTDCHNPHNVWEGIE